MSGKATKAVRAGVPWMAAAALTIAVAGTVGLAALVDPGPGGVGALVPLPEDVGPGWGVGWSSHVRAPEARRAEALTEAVAHAGAGLAALVLLALLTALLRLVGRREAVRPALAVRWAIGAAPRALAGELVTRAWPLLARACLAGTVAGVGLAVLLRASWPIGGDGRGWSLVALLAIPGVLAPVLLALASPAAGLGERSVPLLRTGSGGTDDPRAGTVRRAAATLQLGAAAALVLAGATLGAEAGAREGGSRASGGDTLLVPLHALSAGVEWSAVERLLGATAPESLSTRGAWTGHGVQDLVTVECGRCSRGGLPLPLYGVAATLHAVSPGFFDAAGLGLLSGRGFGPGDGPGAPAVGIVSAPFARDHFEDGRPLGRRIRLGGPGDRWVTVVGIVEALDFQAPGSAAPGAPVLYLPLGQHPAGAVTWSLPPAEAAPAVPPEAPVSRAAPPTTVGEERARARAPVRWMGRTLWAAGVAGLLLALAGAADVAGAEARGRWRETAVRSALGAPPRRLVARFLRRVVATALVGSAVGWIVAWSLVAATGGGARISPSASAALVLLLAAASLAGAAGPARTAIRADPAVLLREGG